MNEIKRIREILKMSQSEFSKNCSCLPSAISNYENGRSPHIKWAKKIRNFALSKGLETSLDKIYSSYK